MKEQLTAVFEKVPEGYIAFVEELPGANTQGATLEQARANFKDAVQLVLAFSWCWRRTGQLPRKRCATNQSFESHSRKFREAGRSNPHLERYGAQFLREGGNHSVYVNRKSGKASTIPRHREINEFLAQKICRDLEIPKP
jgi:mRNA interferase HicA